MVTRTNKGFTLIEILVVIGLIAILAAIVLIAINPARQFAQARNTQRQSNVATILNALGHNIADNKGLLGGTCSSVSISATTTIGTTAGSGYVDLSCLVPTYISSSIPVDPDGGSAADTGYKISRDTTTGRFMICAEKHAESSLGAGVYCLTR